MAAAEETAQKTICLNCGVASEDDEVCPACGRLRDASLPAGKISLTDTLVNGIGSWISEAVIHPDRDISEMSEVNPVTGLPMVGRVGGLGGVDTAGNIYGTSND